MSTLPSYNRPAAIAAGIAAAILSTAGQLLLWWLFWDALPEMLYRDARLAAAIVLGSAVLPPPATFEWSAMLAATLVHFGLSIAYAMLIARIIAAYDMPMATLAGALCGAALFIINMYGFTMLFPWFAEARDWITMVAHVIFGVTAAVVYKAMSRHRRSASKAPTNP